MGRRFLDRLTWEKKSPITGQIVTAVVKLKKPEPLKEVTKRIYDYCKDKIERYKVPSIITITEENLISERFKKIRSI